LIAAATGAESAAGEGAAKEVVLDVYSTVGWVAVAAGVAVILVSPWVKRLMHLDTLRDHDVDHAMAGERELAEPIAPGIKTDGELKPGEARS
jgi:proton-dependent oligopeptide transporter, POT family